MPWETDLIGYDALRSYGSQSYYAQVMFASHIGDKTLQSELTGAGPKLFYSVTQDTKNKRIYLKLVNAESLPQTVNVSFTGGSLSKMGKLESLSAHSTQATNTLEHPQNIVPVESTLQNIGSKLPHTMPAYSIQILQIDTQ
jgi:alpha-L-arabinofuranosidase